MFYLIEPPARLLWTELSARLLQDAARDHGIDLGRLDWRGDTDKTATPAVIRTALAHGIACSRGVAVEPHVIIDLFRPVELRDLLKRHRTNQPLVRAMDERTEAIMQAMRDTDTDPKTVDETSDWVADGDRLASEIEAMSIAQLDRAERRAAEIASASPRPDLVSHWETLGGLTEY